MTSPRMTPADTRAHQTFIALMWALSYPGRAYPLPAAELSAFVAISEALIDLETSFYTPDAALHQQLVRSGARSRPVDQAVYQFYPTLDDTGLRALRAAPVGTALAPDQSATLVIGCELTGGQRLRLRGPGIADATNLHVAGVPDDLWTLRNTACRFPLGWDLFLVADNLVAGVPRTTHLEVG